MSREQIADWFETKIKDMKAGVPSGNTAEFMSVTRDPIDTSFVNKMAIGDMVAGVYDLDESIERISTGENRKFMLTIEVYMKPMAGTYKATQINRILLDLGRYFRKTQCDGLALIVQEVNNSIDIDGVFDRVIGGSLTFEVTYRVNYC